MTPYEAGFAAGLECSFALLVSWLAYDDRIEYRAGWMAGMKARGAHNG